MDLVAQCVPDVQAHSESLTPHPTLLLLVFTGWDLVEELDMRQMDVSVDEGMKGPKMTFRVWVVSWSLTHSRPKFRQADLNASILNIMQQMRVRAMHLE